MLVLKFIHVIKPISTVEGTRVTFIIQNGVYHFGECTTKSTLHKITCLHSIISRVQCKCHSHTLRSMMCLMYSRIAQQAMNKLYQHCRKFKYGNIYFHIMLNRVDYFHQSASFKVHYIIWNAVVKHLFVINFIFNEHHDHFCVFFCTWNMSTYSCPV